MKDKHRTKFVTKDIFKSSVIGAFTKLNPKYMMHNPVMFVVEIGFVIALLLSIFPELFGPTDGINNVRLYNIFVCVILFVTVLFANFAEAVAEGRGKAQAESLKKTQKDTKARLLKADGTETVVSSSELKKGDVVMVSAGEIIPNDGEVIEGTASVDESAITGESAPVLRESGGDFASVTGGTTVVSDWLKAVLNEGVGLQHQPLQGQPAENVGGPAGVLEGDVAGEGEHPAPVYQHPSVLQAAGVAVEHPPDAGVGADDVQAVPVGVPVVDDGGEVELLRQGELGVEEVPGAGPRLRRLEPVVVQADLPHRHHLRVGAQGLDGVQVGEGRPLQILRVVSGGGVEKAVPLRQGDGLAGGLQIAAGADHQGHPPAGQGGEQRVPVGVEGLVVVVGVGVKNHRADLTVLGWVLPL